MDVVTADVRVSCAPLEEGGWEATAEWSGLTMYATQADTVEEAFARLAHLLARELSIAE
jgi:hypothetical protein